MPGGDGGKEPADRAGDRLPGGNAVEVREFRPLRRRGVQRLAREQWGAGRSIWSADVDDRALTVDQVRVTEAGAPLRVAEVFGLEPGEPVCVRSRRFVLDGTPVMLSTSYLPAALVAGTRITEEDSGPGGTYARLAEIGAAPVRFREEVRSRMPTEEEVSRLAPAAGTPVVLVRRTAFTSGGQGVEVNEMVLDSACYVLEYEFDA
ncbi:UTRA domain-containing protein [Kitasatospora sp. NPDC094015]|uniref:GntR family transcriptional regulator n=1 Tax=Kitasatospora sp. NPDC094015 TaxID=3155205 RepID=UPI003320268D